VLELDITIYRHQCNLLDEINIKDCLGATVEHSSPFMAYPTTTMNYQPLCVVVDTQRGHIICSDECRMYLLWRAIVMTMNKE